MTKQFSGNNPILHINLLLQICLKLKVMKNKVSVKWIVWHLKIYTKWRLKFTYLKITYTLNYHYLNYPKTNCTVTATKGIEFCFVFQGHERRAEKKRRTTDKLTKINLVKLIWDMLIQNKQLFIFEPLNKNNHFIIARKGLNWFHEHWEFS